MPVRAEGNKIIEKKTGKVVGRAKTPEAAKRAARVKNAVVYGGFKPARRKPARSSEGSY